LFNVIYRQNLNTTQAVEKITSQFPNLEETDIITGFISKTKRGVLKNFRTPNRQ
ncbi:MAG: hypothetical protein GY757_54950, partial [bacterium]|nr:hypothetical protein [bacterium]